MKDEVSEREQKSGWEQEGGREPREQVPIGPAPGFLAGLPHSGPGPVLSSSISLSLLLSLKAALGLGKAPAQ